MPHTLEREVAEQTPEVRVQVEQILAAVEKVDEYRPLAEGWGR
jgi:hypothetical protein